MIDLAQFYDNCVYSSIAHALFVLREPFFEAEQSWDGMNYCFNDFEGTRGTISFDLSEKILAGAARNDISARCDLYPQFKAAELFKNAPDNVKRLAEKETLEYLYDEAGGVTQPMATAAFWSVGGEIVIDENIEEFKENGGEYLFVLSVGHDELRDYWQEQYELSDEELSAVDLIYERFKAHEPVRSQDVPLIRQKGEQDPNGYEECIASLGELGIVIE